MKLNKCNIKRGLIHISKLTIFLIFGISAIITVYIVKDDTFNNPSMWNGLIASATIVGLNILLFMMGEVLK